MRSACVTLLTLIGASPAFGQPPVRLTTDGSFKQHIHRVNADGTGDARIIPNKAFEESPRWAPDGKSFLFVSTRDGNQEIYRADVDGQNIRRLTSEVAAD